MATLEPISGPDEKVDEPWKPPQRPGKLGVDYDELGMEMAPNARVWKKYVEETDRMDKELVEGWNNSLDIILIFAALFSAISTAFVIESSKDLKPDYSQTSAQTLQLMSQTLSAIARGSPPNDSDTTAAETPEFTPSPSAIAVNTLWFLSLGLSVAVSLIAILAKEWCHSFMAGRVGSMLRQARLRQQRWDGIERWKMKEILYVLPLLMHTALLLFAVGLSLYLWDIDIRVALPVVITTSLAVLFYVVTVSLPLFFRFCPYTTALARFLYPYWLGLLENQYVMDSIGALMASLAWISHICIRIKSGINRGVRPAAQGLHRNDDIEATWDFQAYTPPFTFRYNMQAAREPIQKWVESMRAMFSTDRSQLVETETPMDSVASSMIAWMIVNCEDSGSVDTALQALAGAKQPLPRKPLWECGAVDLLYQRIRGLSSLFMHGYPGGLQLAQSSLLDDASLYSRSFCFLAAFIGGEGLDPSDISGPCFVVKEEPDLMAMLQQTMYLIQDDLLWSLPGTLNYAWEQPTPRYDLVAYGLDLVPVNASRNVWRGMAGYRGPPQIQQELVHHIAAGKVANLPSSAVSALIAGVTKSYLYDTLQSPKLLIDLFHLLKQPSDTYFGYRDALGLGLAVAAFATGSYPNEDAKDDHPKKTESNLHLARDAYMKLTGTMDMAELATARCFGLLSFLNHKTEGKWTFDTTEIKLIGNQLDCCPISLSYHEVFPGIPASFDCGHHLVQILSTLLHEVSLNQGQGPSPESALPVLLRIEAALALPLCDKSNEIVPLLTQHFISTKSAKLKQICLRGISHSLNPYSDCLDTTLGSLVRTGLLQEVLEATSSTHGELATITYCMAFLWRASSTLLDLKTKQVPKTHHSFSQSLLRTLQNPFTISSAEDNFPDNCDELGLTTLWLPKIHEICHSNPRAVLDSNLVSTMIGFYWDEAHSDCKPRTTELPSKFDSTWTWLRILHHWEKSCKEAVERQSQNILPIKKEMELVRTICSVSRQEGEAGSCLDMHDWSI